MPVIVARSVARFTFATLTPGTAFSAFSTRLTHEAQVIPSIDNSVAASATSYPACSTALINASRSMGVLDVISARSVAKFTDA